MKKLKEIAEVVTQRRLKKIELFDEFYLADEQNKLNELYFGLKDRLFSSDKDAAEALYHTNPLDSKYRQLKFRFKTRMLNTLFFLDPKGSDVSDYHRAYYKVNKQWTQIRILLANGARMMANELLVKTLQKAETYKLYDIAYLCSKDLQNHYALQGNQKQFDRSLEKTKLYEKILAAENEAQELYQRIIIKFASSIARRPEDEFISMTQSNLQRLKKLSKEHNSYLIDYTMYSVWGLVHELESDYQSALKVYEKTEDYLRSNPKFYQAARIAEISLKKMVCYLHLRDYKMGIESAKKCIQLFRIGSNNWFVYKEYHFLLAMHTGDYKRATKIFSETTKHDRYNFITAEQKEKWRIFNAYLYYVSSNGKQSKSKQEEFNLFKFLTKVPIYSKDKKGYNIAILIIQILIQLDARKYDEIMKNGDALKAYSGRHMQLVEYYRSKCFINMLLIMEKKGFDFQQTTSATESLYNELKDGKETYQRHISDMEVIPFEILWENVLETLHKAEAEN